MHFYIYVVARCCRCCRHRPRPPPPPCCVKFPPLLILLIIIPAPIHLIVLVVDVLGEALVLLHRLQPIFSQQISLCFTTFLYFLLHINHSVQHF